MVKGERDEATQQVIEKLDITQDQHLLSPDGSYHSSNSISSLNDFQVALKRNSSMVSLGSYTTGVPVDAVATTDDIDEPKGKWYIYTYIPLRIEMYPIQSSTG